MRNKLNSFRSFKWLIKDIPNCPSSNFLGVKCTDGGKFIKNIILAIKLITPIDPIATCQVKYSLRSPETILPKTAPIAFPLIYSPIADPRIPVSISSPR